MKILLMLFKGTQVAHNHLLIIASGVGGYWSKTCQQKKTG